MNGQLKIMQVQTDSCVRPVFPGQTDPVIVIGDPLTGFFPNPSVMYIVDLVLLAAGLVMMIFSNDKFVGKR